MGKFLREYRTYSILICRSSIKLMPIVQLSYIWEWEPTKNVLGGHARPKQYGRKSTTVEAVADELGSPLRTVSAVGVG